MSFLLRETNTKCIAIGGGLMLAYWLAPTNIFLVLGALGISSYTAIGWYGSIYDCDTKLVSYDGICSGLFGRMKPNIGKSIFILKT